MFVKFHERLKDSEKGFTLIELLVVILIIAILAAIAIPVFLSQRKKGFRSQARSALKNAATAEESYATENNGQYTNVLGNLISEGYVDNGVVTLTIPTATASVFCIQAAHPRLTGDAWATSHYISTRGEPLAGNCPP